MLGLMGVHALIHKGKARIALLITAIAIVIWALSPCIMPPNYTSLPEKERAMVEAAIRDAERHLEGTWALTLRLDLVEIFKKPHFKHHLLQGEAWEVRLRGYTFFNIPLCEVRVIVDDATLNGLCGSIRPAGYQWPDKC
jgi:hypothetical protein